MTILEKVILTHGDFSTGLRTRNINHEKVIALSDNDFQQFYLELMTEYKTKDGWWNPDNSESIPQCSNCRKIISGPEQLRRYHGNSLHPNCFREEWAKEGGSYNNHALKRYFDRIAQLKMGE